MTADHIVASLRAKSPNALAELLDSYGDQLFQYCWCMLRSRDIAQIALRDTLVVAQAHIARLTEPELLGTWLHALARAECGRCRFVASSRPEEGPWPPEDPWPAGDQSEASGRSQAGESPGRPSQGYADSQLMAWNAAMSMAPDEFEALELACRHEVDLGLVLGLSAEDAQVLLDRGKQNLERALGAEILVSRGSQACPDLAKVMSDWTSAMTPQIRTRVLEHAGGCPVCAPHLPRDVSASRVFARLPAPALSPLARSEVLGFFDDDRLSANREFAGTPTPSPASSGSPVSSGSPAPVRAPSAPRSGPRHRFPLARPAGILTRIGVIAAASLAAAALAIAFLLVRPGAKPIGSSKPAGVQGATPGAPSGPALKPSDGIPPVRTVLTNTARGQDEALITELTKPKAPAPNPGTPALPWSLPPPVITSPPASPGIRTVSPPPASAGTLTVSPARITLGTGSTTPLTLTAAGGPVTWSASAPTSQVSLSSKEGTLQPGQSVTVEVTVSPGLAAGSAAIWIKSPPSPSHTVEVSWPTESSPPPPPPPPSCPPSCPSPSPPPSCPPGSPSPCPSSSLSSSPSPSPSPAPSPTRSRSTPQARG